MSQVLDVGASFCFINVENEVTKNKHNFPFFSHKLKLRPISEI